MAKYIQVYKYNSSNHLLNFAIKDNDTTHVENVGIIEEIHKILIITHKSIRNNTDINDSYGKI